VLRGIRKIMGSHLIRHGNFILSDCGTPGGSKSISLSKVTIVWQRACKIFISNSFMSKTFLRDSQLCSPVGLAALSVGPLSAKNLSVTIVSGLAACSYHELFIDIATSLGVAGRSCKARTKSFDRCFTTKSQGLMAPMAPEAAAREQTRGPRRAAKGRQREAKGGAARAK
jgi:hypothetical protein